MQILIQESNQIALLAAIAKWKENEDNKEDTIAGVFIESITMFPYHNGQVSAVVGYRWNCADDSEKIVPTKHDKYEGSSSSERSVFSAMQGGAEA